ncbi:MAG: SDR family NAD(P)-dependent oxidoreductase [Flavobacteriales bacterium]|jgi:NADP-dependent 3-hydroxy acid dehydrogenase YdfG|nr:SDR family NAD(P)-dependent oxidoreductase [Flavobacteriales bacterium]MCW8912561.1 SDR family NAD(P)-dependent oxidoreductase [Flavobacteriales bacterium]MCW8937529.1 SDR family NAD(P)-dependent oxidoreductase [Flavobacteriales bacterium]MCW8939369.1 SDR family NAD(P)-dependent oxidoreductase [Flavobacteriales bacterium]MCW8968559.1 SDR family NAD(P)-dependent oxidoreductase [Flavobacteriales bacterium]
MTKKIVLISGATSGFGKATAEIFAKNNYNLIITGRREDRLLKIAKDLSEQCRVEVLPLCFDIRDQKAVETAILSLDEPWKKIDYLVNNAGLASGLGLIQDGEIDDWEKMIDTNVKGLLYLSKAIMPIMIANKSGHIINIGSTAGKEVYLNGNVYCATKHAVDAISKSMRIDLLQHGIKVTQICPGAAETEFSEVRFHGDKEKAKNIYKGYQPMTAEDIASLIYFAATLPPHLCINDLVVTSLAQANSFYLNKNS